MHPRLSWIQPYMGQGLFQERENNVRADKTIVRLRHPGRGLQRGGEGGGGKKFLLLKKRENFDPLQNYTQNSDILRKNTLTILLFTYHFLHIKFAISWKGWQPNCQAIRRATNLAMKGMQRWKDRNRFAKKKKNKSKFLLMHKGEKIVINRNMP